ncbi:DUF732 domain-containing protein [Mycobacterium sp. 141]|uniref:DUF732 domain-containing protein n=1 Tax=Mycobacterium sp. 141 TaxID=1120797 RepID=UPI00036F3ED2|nr:DUF732 domain-containing protein [Mycobacterium sp. 141]
MLSRRGSRHLAESDPLRVRPTRAIATSVSAAALVVAMAFGVAPAHADTADDTRFLEIVKQLNIPVESPEQAVQAGHGICDKVAAGKIEPARTVRSILGQLTASGLQKGVAVNLIWGAVDVYCPQYRALVGH